jgi:hypothetical protein
VENSNHCFRIVKNVRICFWFYVSHLLCLDAWLIFVQKKKRKRWKFSQYLDVSLHQYIKMGILFSVRCWYSQQDLSLATPVPPNTEDTTVMYCCTFLQNSFAFIALQHYILSKFEFDGRGVCHENSVRPQISSKWSLKNNASFLLCCKVLWDCSSVMYKSIFKWFCSLITLSLKNGCVQSWWKCDSGLIINSGEFRSFLAEE